MTAGTYSIITRETPRTYHHDDRASHRCRRGRVRDRTDPREQLPLELVAFLILGLDGRGVVKSYFNSVKCSLKYASHKSSR